MYIDKNSFSNIIKELCEGEDVSSLSDMLTEDEGCFKDKIYYNAAHVLYFIMETLEEEEKQ